ncbi:MAG: hypothetical protein K1X31_04690 [Gemmatimonadaceae bacterium]|nr:hypothetical protein [Gemmatimonadaceae bacterium]
MTKEFQFTENERTYTCTVEARAGDPSDAWWWFAVSGDQQRYAPFRMERADTQASVRKRIVAFYENRQFQLSQPVVRGGKFRRPGAPNLNVTGPTGPAAG